MGAAGTDEMVGAVEVAGVKPRRGHRSPPGVRPTVPGEIGYGRGVETVGAAGRPGRTKWLGAVEIVGAVGGIGQRERKKTGKRVSTREHRSHLRFAKKGDLRNGVLGEKDGAANG